MISRRTAQAIADVYTGHFSHIGSHAGARTFDADGDRLYDFLYECDFPAWLCNAARATGNYSYSDMAAATRKMKDFILRLHTGESLVKATPEWSWEERRKLGQQYLYNVTRVMLDYYNEGMAPSHKRNLEQKITEMLSRLELDGYIYRDSRLLLPEGDVLDVEHEIGLLQSLYTSLQLLNEQTAFQALRLSEEHYIAERWEDSIHNSRKFLEGVLQEVATAHASKRGAKLPADVYTSPGAVREYLKTEGLLDAQERDALKVNYGLLSKAGSHPYMAKNDQARLLRQLALTLSQFVMLRLQGELTQQGQTTEKS